MKLFTNRIVAVAGSLIRVTLLFSGAIALVMAILAFTRVPFDMHRWLGETGSHYRFAPDQIVMLGGSGMPSESNLIRLYYTAHLAQLHPGSSIIIAHPHDASVAGSMSDYLIAFGIDSTRISLMMEGTNTREQALRLSQLSDTVKTEKTVVVTSPENMYRTIRVFRRAGFEKVGGTAAFENAMFVDLTYQHQSIGGKVYTPDVSGNLDLRYNFWNYLKLEITCLREWVAIFYYWVNGWI
jgi:uncharacterized SAM-binding protein YcdF (DUF218 family)